MINEFQFKVNCRKTQILFYVRIIISQTLLTLRPKIELSYPNIEKQILKLINKLQE